MEPERDADRANELLSRLMRGSSSDGQTANELLAAFQHGYPVSKLRLLLRANDREAVAAGIWIASELGASSRPLFDDFAELLGYPFARVRFFALDCMLSCARPEDEGAINRALDLVEDPDPGVRWKALVFLATVPDPVLRAARGAAVKLAPNGARARGLELLESSTLGGAQPITDGLADNDALMRSYAAAAAARIVHRDAGPLRQAAKSEDVTIRQFAKDMAARAGIVADS